MRSDTEWWAYPKSPLFCGMSCPLSRFSLTFFKLHNVRQFDPNMKSMPTCATGSRCANAHLLRPADDQNARRSGLFITATVALRSYGQAQMRQPALRCATRPSLIAHEALSKSNPGKRRPTRQSPRGAAEFEPHQPEKPNNQNGA